MLTPSDKIRAARMYAVDFFRALIADNTGDQRHSITFNQLFLDIATGRFDHFASVANALRALNRLEPSDGVHNAVQALQYLRGRDRPFDAPHPMGDNPARFLRVFAPLTTGYVNAHSSTNRH